MHFLEWKLLSFKLNFTELCSLWSYWQYSSIGSNNGLVPNRRWAIIWANDSLACWCIYMSLGLNELRSETSPMKSVLQFSTEMAWTSSQSCLQLSYHIESQEINSRHISRKNLSTINLHAELNWNFQGDLVMWYWYHLIKRFYWMSQIPCHQDETDIADYRW